MRAEIIGVVPFGEGPVWCDDGTLVVCSAGEGALYRVGPNPGQLVRFADTKGGANGAAPAQDGGFLVAQNGGVDISRLGVFPNPPQYRPVNPGLQYVDANGVVTYILQGGLQAPNDLVVGPDNTVYFTDPPAVKVEIHDGKPRVAIPTEPVGRIMKLNSQGELTVFADRFLYCNGIGFDQEGQIVVVEARGLQRVWEGGRREWVIQDLGPGGGDGFCVDVDGRFYVAGTTDNCIRVVEPGGKIVEVLETPGADQHPTNCCFGGKDNRTLFAAEMPGRVLCWEGMPTAGRPLTPWSNSLFNARGLT
jgi:gluconolactonase